MTRRSTALILAPAAAVCALLATGCGGTGSPRVATSASSATTTAGTTTVRNGSLAGALAFARCMRAHGMPNWPDPAANGVFDKRKLRQLGIAPSRVRSIEERSCNYDFENGGQGETITPADRADYLRAAACMRSHGFPSFPDPTFQDGHVSVDVPSSDESSPRFRRAAETCTRLIPKGLPYSLPGGS